MGLPWVFPRYNEHAFGSGEQCVIRYIVMVNNPNLSEVWADEFYSILHMIEHSRVYLIYNNLPSRKTLHGSVLFHQKITIKKLFMGDLMMRDFLGFRHEGICHSLIFLFRIVLVDTVLITSNQFSKKNIYIKNPTIWIVLQVAQPVFDGDQ